MIGGGGFPLLAKLNRNLMKRPRLLVFTVVCLALGACSSSRTGPLRLYQRNSGEMIRLYVGETLEVVLDGDPRTDIHWLKAPGDPEILEQIGETQYEQDLETHSAERKLITRFRATAPGRMRLQLNYNNPARNTRIMSGRPPGREFEVWVVVREKG